MYFSSLNKLCSLLVLYKTPNLRLDGNGTGVSPLQGTKIVIQNLQTSVTQVSQIGCTFPSHCCCCSQEDILELFGDIGALRRAKLVNPGHAEVTFINKADAARWETMAREKISKIYFRAVEIYHNRQLDGKPMKCTMVGVNK